MAKPFSIQSPEDIAKEYAGNKQKIAQAMQMGIVDPTAGVLAGMFIDRMRAAQAQEQAPQATVAQQVMGGAPPVPANPLPAGGLGAPAPAAPPMTPPMGMAAPMPEAPPMGMAPPMPMPEAPPMGMADGGLAMLPVPDAMFDEPTNGGFDDGYAGGGIVAFNPGGPVKEEAEEEVELGPEGAVGEIVVTKARNVAEPAGPDEYYGAFRDPFRMLDRINELAPQSTKRREQVNAYLDRILSPEEQKKRKKEDMWAALAQLGAKMATTPGTLLQAASAGISEALPGAVAAAKERRAEERGALAELAKNEGLTNAEALDRYRLVQAGNDQYGRFNEGRLTREQQERLAIYEQQQANWRAQQQVGAQIQSARIGAAGQAAFMEKQLIQLQRQVAAGAVAELPALRAALNNPIGLANNTYKQAVQKYGGNSTQAQAAYATLQDTENAYVQTAVQRASGGIGGGGSSRGFEGFDAEPMQ